MGLNFKTAKMLYNEMLEDVTMSASSWLDFLKTSTWMFEYSFGEQLLIYAQRPDARACASMEDWNQKQFRWIKKGTKAITLMRYRDSVMRLENVFDISDTYQRYGAEQRLWNVNIKRDEADLAETLESRYGKLEDKDNLAFAIISSVYNMVEDNVKGYLEEINCDEETKTEFTNVLRDSVIYMTLNRCNIEPTQFVGAKNFENIFLFNTNELTTGLGVACQELSRDIIREIRTFVKNRKHTFDKEEPKVYLESENKEEGRELNVGLQRGKELSSSEFGNRKEEFSKSEWQVRKGEGEILENTKDDNIRKIEDARGINPTLERNTNRVREDGRTDNRTNEEERENNGRIESTRPNDLGETYEQPKNDSGTNSVERASLYLGEYTLDNTTGLIVTDEKVNQILNRASNLTVTKQEIINFFDNEKGIEKRADYIKNAFNNIYTEIYLNDKRYGYKDFDNGLLVWKGSFLSKEAESLISWQDLTKHYESMILLHQLKDDTVKYSNTSQISFLETSNQSSEELEFTDEFVEKFLVQEIERHSEIYEQFISSFSGNENAEYLKRHYGEGGRSHTINGSGIGIEYNSKGMLFYRGYLENRLEKLFNWSNIEKRVSNIIHQNKIVIEDKNITDEVVTEIAEPKEVPISTVLEKEKINYKITREDLGVGTLSEKYKRNIEAIKVLKKCEEENRLATADEQEILSQYVGWGGLQQAFDERELNWKSKYGELKDLLTEKEYTDARASTLTAFYTPPIVIKSIYTALENIGVRNANILEPSCGTGNFFGLLVDSLENCKMYGVELDSLTARIAKQLYQKSDIQIGGYENIDLPNNFFDVAVGNVPFGDFKVVDKKYEKNNFLIHDYFFAKTIDKVRAGGIIAFITSKGTLDKENSKVRKYIAERTELIGAIRLPNNTFSKNAETKVTSDIIFLQKREKPIAIEPEWVHLGVSEDGIKMNQYFVDNPNMILGKMEETTNQYGRTDYICKPKENTELKELLNDAIKNIKANVVEYEVDEIANKENQTIPANLDVRNYSYTVVENKIYFREDSKMFLQEMSSTAEKRVKGLINIRECVRRLIALQTDNAPDEDIQNEQVNLNVLYDEFVNDFGRITDRGNKQAFGEDSSYYLLSSLEVLDDKGNFLKKADMFSKRTIKARNDVKTAETSAEALIISMSEKAKVDLEYMSALIGKSEDEIIEELRGTIFKLPYTNEYVTNDEYLSGNVREKLKMAQEAVKTDESLNINVKALEEALPKEITAGEIKARLGATWIPKKVIQQFIFELLETPRYRQMYIDVNYSDITSNWNITNKSIDSGNVKAYTTYGTRRINAYKIIEDTLNLKNVRIYDYEIDDEGKKVKKINKKETAIAIAKQDQIKDEFENWIWSDPNRRKELVELYNEKFNSIRPREYNGERLTFGGMNPEITLRKHQVNAIAHILYGGNTLLAHEVGAGKTFEMVAAAMETKRLGLCNKSLFVVPNHIVEQIASDFLRLYPSANILVATQKDFSTNYRKRFCSKIATGEYDAIIIGHSQFEKVPVSVERQVYQLNCQLDDIMMGIEDLKSSDGERYTIKELEKSKKKIEEKLAKLNDRSRKDDVITFEELGVDRMFVDEAHNYKNLFLYTKMRNVAGISQTEAQKSSDLFMKCRYLDEITNNKGVIFATGTPVSNSMVEMYTMQRYLQYETLLKNNLQHFDAWASVFGETVNAIELAPEGTGYRAKTKFAKFNNLPELMAMFKEVADIQTSDTLNLPVPEAEFNTVVVKPSEIQQGMVEKLGERAENVRGGGVDATVDNMLKITNDGRKLALDQRLINDLLPEYEEGKINTCANNIYEIYKKYDNEKMSQLVFCDLSTPKDLVKSSEFFDIVEKDKNAEVPFTDAYTELKCKLMKLGIPKKEIAFIHEADNEVKKRELFAKVRNGNVRVLVGSTAKMGAGTNVQKKLIALHDLDCPWRPADLTQRLGRIVRQGNTNAKVFIYRYVTEGTFDAYLYQIIENKQKFISQIMTSKTPVRTADDIDEVALSYAEIKALAAGNPLIIEKTELDSEVSKLKLLKQEYLNQKYMLEDKIIKYYPVEIANKETYISNVKLDKSEYLENKNKYGDNFPTMTINNQVYSDKEKAGNAILEALKSIPRIDTTTEIGIYRGFKMAISYNTVFNIFNLHLKNHASYRTELGKDTFGNIKRIENIFENFDKNISKATEELEILKQQFDNAKEEVKKEFKSEDILNEKTKRLSEVNSLLDIKEKENDFIGFEDTDDEINKPDPNKDRDR